jgi:F0F1-type ATP synthase membrane subunit b/b'
MILDILHQLGMDHTLPFYVVINTIAIFILSYFIFSPFSKALQERLKNTASTEEVSAETKIETQQMKTQFEIKAREISQKIKSIFDEKKSQGQTQAAAILSDARKQSEALLAQEKSLIAKSLAQANEEVAKEVNSLSQSISKKMIGSN